MSPTQTVYTTLESPIGELLALGDGRALHGLYMQHGRRPIAVDASWERLAEPFAQVRAQLEEYFAGKRTEFEVPLAMDGSAFEQRVWQALQEIPYGETISYAELAAWVGRPGAFRAVGQANGANPIAIIVPCHRVVAAGGGLGGYGGGLDLKRRLLDLERYAAAAAADMAGNGPASAARPASPSAAKAGSKSRSVSSAAAS